MKHYELSDCKGIDRIFDSNYLSRIKRYSAINFRAIAGIDTETDSKGNIFLTCISLPKAEHHLFSSDSREIIEFLFQHCRNSLNFFYNITFDFGSLVKGIIKTMSKKKALEKYKKGKLRIGNLRIQFIEGKYFKISDGKHQAYFYDSANFFEGSVDDNAKTFLNMSKSDFGVSDSQIDVSKLQTYPMSTQIKRCSVDAMLTRKLSEVLVKTVREKIGINPRHWNSKASLAQELLIRSVRAEHLKPFTKEQQDVVEYALRAYKGGMFVAFSKGLCKNVIEIDLNSAYAFILNNLPDMIHGHWRFTYGFDSSVFYGVYMVMRQFDGFSPYRLSNDRIIYPKTDRLYRDFLTKPEIEFLRERGFKVEVLCGYEFVHDSNPVEYPFREVVSSLVALKESVGKRENNPSLYDLSKTIANAIYGKMAQRKHGIGVLFNPVIASYITALTRINMTRLGLEKYIRLYEMDADSIFGEINPLAKLEPSDKLGNYKIVEDIPKEVVILQTGLTADTKGNIFRKRGIPVRVRENYSPKSNIEFAKEGIKMRSEKAIKVKEALLSASKLAIEDISQFKQIEKVFAYDDGKRLWNNQSIKPKDLFTTRIDSRPHDDISLFELDSFTDVDVSCDTLEREESELFLGDPILRQRQQSEFQNNLIGLSS